MIKILLEMIGLEHFPQGEKEGPHRQIGREMEAHAVEKRVEKNLKGAEDVDTGIAGGPPGRSGLWEKMSIPAMGSFHVITRKPRMGRQS